MSWLLKQYVTHQQLVQYNAEITSKIKAKVDDKLAQFQSVDELINKFAEFENKITELEKNFNAIQIPSPVNLDPLIEAVTASENKIAELEKNFDAIQIPPPVNLDPLIEAVTASENKIAELEKNFNAIQIPPPINLDPLNKAVVAIGNRLIALEKKVEATPPVNLDPLNKAVNAIGNRLIALEKKVEATPPPVNLDPLNKAVNAIGNRLIALEQKVEATPPPVNLDPLLEAIDKLNAEISSLRQSNAELSTRLENLERKPEPEQPAPPEEEIKPEPEPTPEEESPEKIFYLPEQAGAFIPNERRKISSQVKKALDVKELKKFLLANPTAAPSNFQRLLETHVKDMQKFVNKLNLKDLDNEELSETVTAKYFKLFQRIIFDNLLIVVKDRLKPEDEFYPAFLSKLNEYLSRCGIYTVNAHSGEKVSDADFENMSPQILKTDDKNLAETVKEIVRLPYRINYISKATGETDFFQYNGVMTLYKAVQ